MGVHFEIPSFGNGPHNWVAQYISITRLNVTNIFHELQNVKSDYLLSLGVRHGVTSAHGTEPFLMKEV